MKSAAYRGAMKAVVLVEDGKLSYTDVAVPERPGPGWALVRVAFSSVCSSDMHRAFGRGAYRYPLIMGHEFSGYVDEPAQPGQLPRGTAVTVFPLIPCRKCGPCQVGEYAQCMDYDYLGSRRDGAFAELVWAPEDCLVPVPAGVGMREAALTEPCAVALHGAEKLSVRAGTTAAVFGGGPIGNMAAQWIRLRGCHTVFVVDVEPDKLDLAADMGFTPVDARAVDPVQRIRELTAGVGADRVMEAVGLPRTFLQAVQCAARFGEVVFLGNIHGTLEIGEGDVSSILRRELVIRGTWNSRITPAGRSEWDAVLGSLGRGDAPAGAVAGRINVDRLISHTPPLSDGVEVLRRMRDRAEPFSKVVFTL
jgi:L-iditol 2-dehydrogenase/galactitol-1-phosphate 5-dehydrogenase